MKLRDNKFDIGVDIVCIISLALATVVLMMTWKSFGDQGRAGVTAGLMGSLGARASFLLLLSIGWLVFLVFTVIEKLPKTWSIGYIEMSKANKDKIYRIFKNLLGSVKLIVTVLFSAVTVMNIYGKNPGTSFYNGAVLLLIAVVTGLSIQMMVVNKKN
jgi:hypothetical protein